MTSTARIVVVHDIPGRLRVRVAAYADTAALETTLRKQPGVQSCRRSAQSLLIVYRSRETTADRLMKIIASSLTGRLIRGTSTETAGDNVPMSRMIIQALESINAGITRATGNNFDVRTLLALALAAWAGRQILRGEGPQGVPWSTALWYAYGLFRHHNASVTASAAAHETPASSRAPVRRPRAA